ncbi:MAG: UDP-N-acetylmuramoyl-L-alanine--D-glutamate ligase [Nitrospiraceae bacterium]|nr:UDP-N-acetylmuramoyl-L-alanine--D-glutamate ligase [Nitrospiraceae bacterium]
MELKGKKVTVLGMGLSGQAMARWLLSQGAEVLCSDICPLDRWSGDLVSWCDENGVGVEAGDHKIETCVSSDLLVVSPGISPDVPAIKAAFRSGVPVVGELALAASLWKGPLVGITGTNGKTTTTMLVDEMLSKAGLPHVVAGNIGTPLSAYLDKGYTEDTIAVLEVSSFQLDYLPGHRHLPISLPRFKVTAWLNLAPDHLDRYHDITDYGESKAKIFDLQGPGDWSIRNIDDPGIRPWMWRGRAMRLYFGGRHSGIPGAWLDTHEGEISVMWSDNHWERYDLGGWSLKGHHNLENLACAILISRLVGAGRGAIQSVIQGFKAPPHRLQWIVRVGDIDYYDDSKATNVASVLRAVESVDQVTVLILGGRGKGEDYSRLAEATKNGHIRGAITIGEEAKALNRVLGRSIPVIEIEGLDEGREIMRDAIMKATSLAEPGDAVVLSPACASFDLFKNYEERGKAFQEAVQELCGRF